MEDCSLDSRSNEPNKEGGRSNFPQVERDQCHVRAPPPLFMSGFEIRMDKSGPGPVLVRSSYFWNDQVDGERGGDDGSTVNVQTKLG